MWSLGELSNSSKRIQLEGGRTRIWNQLWTGRELQIHVVYITFTASYSHEKWKEPRIEAWSLSLPIVEAKRGWGLEKALTVRQALSK